MTVHTIPYLFHKINDKLKIKYESYCFDSSNITNLEYNILNNEFTINEFTIIINSLSEEIATKYSKIIYNLFNILIHNNDIEKFKIIENKFKYIIQTDRDNFNKLKHNQPNFETHIKKTIFFNTFFHYSKLIFYLYETYKYDIRTIFYLNTFFCNSNFNNFIFNKLKTLNIDTIEIEDVCLSNHTYNLNNNNNYESILKFHYLLKNQNIYKNYKYITLIERIIYNNNIEFLKIFIEYKSYYLKFCLSESNSYNILSKLKYKQYIEQDNYDKNTLEIIIILLPFIKYNIGNERLINILEPFLNDIVIKKNAVDFFKCFENNNINIDLNFIDSFNFPIIADCLKYGTIKTLDYLLKKKVIINNNLLINPQLDLIDCSLVNCNYNIMDKFLKKIQYNQDIKLCTRNIDSYVSTISQSLNYRKINIKKYSINSFKTKIKLFVNFLHTYNSIHKNDITHKNDTHLVNYFLSKILYIWLENSIKGQFILNYEFEIIDFEFLKQDNLYKDYNNFLKIYRLINRKKLDKNYYNIYLSVLDNNCSCKTKKL